MFLTMFFKQAKHRANDASNDVNRPPLGAGGQDRFPNSTRGARLVQPGTNQASQAILRFPGRTFSASLRNQPTNSLNSTSPLITWQRTIALCTSWVHCLLGILGILYTLKKIMKTANWDKGQSAVGTAVHLSPFVGSLACRKMRLDQTFLYP